MIPTHFIKELGPTVHSKWLEFCLNGNFSKGSKLIKKKSWLWYNNFKSFTHFRSFSVLSHNQRETPNYSKKEKMLPSSILKLIPLGPPTQLTWSLKGKIKGKKLLSRKQTLSFLSKLYWQRKQKIFDEVTPLVTVCFKSIRRCNKQVCQ